MRKALPVPVFRWGKWSWKSLRDLSHVTDLWKVGKWNSGAALTPEASALQSHLSDTNHIRLLSVSLWELAGFESLNWAAQPVLPPDPKVTQCFIELFLFSFLLIIPFLSSLSFPSLFLSFLWLSKTDWLLFRISFLTSSGPGGGEDGKEGKKQGGG